MENNENEKIIGEFTNKLAEVLNESQNDPYQYVVEYRLVNNDKLLGYHGSTFCQLTEDRLSGK